MSRPSAQTPGRHEFRWVRYAQSHPTYGKRGRNPSVLGPHSGDESRSLARRLGLACHHSTRRLALSELGTHFQDQACLAVLPLIYSLLLKRNLLTRSAVGL